RARDLRRDLTPMERRLWARLRRRQFHGLHFRRQHPLGRYVLDFFCAEYRLVVEVDGPSHHAQVEHDAARTEWLEAQGCRVLRFTNEQVRHHLDDVLAAIQAQIAPVAEEES